MQNILRGMVPLFLIALALGVPAAYADTAAREKVELGRTLFFDKRLSADNTVSCATCHDPKFGFSDRLPVSTGIKGQKGTRSAPTVINRLYGKTQFWDGRAATLEEQAKGPLVNPIEMGMPDHDAVVKKLQGIKGYAAWFKEVFGRDVTIDDAASAIAAFERTVVSDDSRYDQYIAGDKKALSASERRGFEVFSTKGRCAICHGGPNFTDEEFHNIGVGMNKAQPDLGRYTQTKNEDDKGAFKTPTLRDIVSTAPYLHDGSEKTLDGVVAFYDRGGIPNPNLHPLMEKLGLTKQERKDLVAFMKALSGDRWRKIAPPKEFPR